MGQNFLCYNTCFNLVDKIVHCEIYHHFSHKNLINLFLVKQILVYFMYHLSKLSPSNLRLNCLKWAKKSREKNTRLYKALKGNVIWWNAMATLVLPDHVTNVNTQTWYLSKRLHWQTLDLSYYTRERIICFSLEN